MGSLSFTFSALHHSGALRHDDSNSDTKCHSKSKDKRGCAPHMRNDDTPSLGGWCIERQMFPCGNVCRSSHLQKHGFRGETGWFRAETFTSEVQ